MTAQEHERAAAGLTARCGIITLSDTRSPEDDASGDLIAARLAAAGHEVVERALLPDDRTALAARLDHWLPREGLEVIITTGGTGIASRDVTIGVIRERVSSELPGFGEIFRTLSFEQVGPAALLSRALAGITARPHARALFALPGSPRAVELALDRLILPILPHLLRELRR